MLVCLLTDYSQNDTSASNFNCWDTLYKTLPRLNSGPVAKVQPAWMTPSYILAAAGGEFVIRQLFSGDLGSSSTVVVAVQAVFISISGVLHTSLHTYWNLLTFRLAICKIQQNVLDDRVLKDKSHNCSSPMNDVDLRFYYCAKLRDIWLY